MAPNTAGSPAHAGIDLCRAPGPRDRTRFPRTRGDRPATGEVEATCESPVRVSRCLADQGGALVQRRKSQARITKTSAPNKERVITRDVSVEPEIPDTERTEGVTKSSRIEKSATPKRNSSTSRARQPRRMTDASSREVPVWHKGCLGCPIRNGERRLWTLKAYTQNVTCPPGLCPVL